MGGVLLKRLLNLYFRGLYVNHNLACGISGNYWIHRVEIEEVQVRVRIILAGAVLVIIFSLSVAASDSLKSDVSLVHEIALKRKFSVEFKVNKLNFFDY